MTPISGNLYKGSITLKYYITQSTRHEPMEKLISCLEKISGRFSLLNNGTDTAFGRAALL
ncbi:MAG: hypothetical protein ACJAZT_001151 [Gammaproteobacteria bacterium]|jgi:hypothetical protein